MARILRLIAAAAVSVMLLPLASASAGVPCAERGEIVKKLSDEYKEKAQAVGVINPEAVVEIFVSENGTWTILATGTDGKSCVLSAGEGFDGNLMAALPDA
ncbi:hypothetical protein [Mesorhizobium sp. WSM2239]|uniref:Uncharacterized protein n=2 Tax=unclassified Mesorhizobium TaxID=325217 RepID=A0AAU8DCI6_9HYPH